MRSPLGPDRTGFHQLRNGDRYRFTGGTQIHTWDNGPGIIRLDHIELVERPRRYDGAIKRAPHPT